jgi:hypothetical protein
VALRPRTWVNGIALLAAVVVIRGAGTPPQSMSPQPGPTTTLTCPFAYFLSNGLCHPYSWSGVTGGFEYDTRVPH